MSDYRRLLEMAAKAMQSSGHPHFANFEYADASGICLELGHRRGAITSYWNSITEDGDAFMLVSRLDISIEFGYCEDDAPVIWTSSPLPGGDRTRHACFPDSLAALKRAVTCAAAAIGEAMP